MNADSFYRQWKSSADGQEEENQNNPMSDMMLFASTIQADQGNLDDILEGDFVTVDSNINEVTDDLLDLLEDTDFSGNEQIILSSKSVNSQAEELLEKTCESIPSIAESDNIMQSSCGNKDLWQLQSITVQCKTPIRLNEAEKKTGNLALIEFCNMYDYDIADGSFSGIMKEIVHKELNEYDAIKAWLNMIAGIIDDGIEYDDAILQYSLQDLDSICPVNRNMCLSELITIARYKNEGYFDPAVIKYFSLEARDTSLLCSLMERGTFNREEALLYTENPDSYNSYLLLVMSEKYNAEVFNKINNDPANVDSYTKSVLSDSKWTFLGSHPDFSRILKSLEEKEVPMELLEAFQNNRYLLQIIQAYQKRIYSHAFIVQYLGDDVERDLADYAASDYANGYVSIEALEMFDGNYYLAKMLYDVKGYNENKSMFINHLSNPDYANTVKSFLQIILNAVVDNKLNVTEWYKFIYYIAGDNIDICKDYKDICVDMDYEFLSFNQFWFFKLLKYFDKRVKVSTDIGELLVYQGRDNLFYLTVQSLAESFTQTCTVIATRLNNDIKIMMLPDKKGIILCKNSFNDFSKEKSKFIKISNSKSSIQFAMENHVKDHIQRYNAIAMMEIATSYFQGTVTDNYKQLLLAPINNYLTYDVLLGLIVQKYNEFAGLCMNPEALQTLKLLNSVLYNETQSSVQIEFFKAYLGIKFGKRFMIERYDTSMSNINIVEVRNSYSYASTTLPKVICTLDKFVQELNRKNNIICRFEFPNKMIIEGI